MNVLCKKCYKSFQTSSLDDNKIKKESTPETYKLKMDNFMCKKCFEKYAKNSSLLIEERAKLNLDVDRC